MTPTATRREWLGLAVLALPTLVASLDIGVLYLALPALSRDLGADSTAQLWITDIYSFMIAGFLVTMGTLGDRVGRRRLLMIGVATFGVASVLAAYSANVAMLIAARALLGVAAATLMPSTLALISSMFADARQRGTAIGVWMSCFMGGLALGPVVGGVLLERFWWGAAFLIGIPFMLVLLAVAPRLLPEFRNTGAGRVDPMSVALSLAAILPTIYGLKELAKHGLAPVPVASVLVGVAFGLLFVRRQRRLSQPLLDLRLFGNRIFATSQATMLLTGVVMAGISLLSALYLQTVRGLSPLEAGLWLLPQNVTMVVGSMLAPAIARRVRPAFVVGVGLCVAAVGFGLLTRVDADGLGLLVTGLVLTSVGISLMMPLMTDLTVGAAPPEKAGSAAAIMQTGGEFGIALGVATLGSLGTAVYRHELAANLPSGLSGDAAEQARRGIADATVAAAGLPHEQAGALLAAARDAFTTGLNAAAVVGAVVLVGLALLVSVTLRHHRGHRGASDEVTSDEVTPTANRETHEAVAAR